MNASRPVVERRSAASGFEHVPGSFACADEAAGQRTINCYSAGGERLAHCARLRDAMLGQRYVIGRVGSTICVEVLDRPVAHQQQSAAFDHRFFTAPLASRLSIPASS
jgi:hypothetical protein